MKTVIDTLKERGLFHACSDGACTQLPSSCKVYIGFDPTAPGLHLGNLIGLIVLIWFRLHGHVPVVLLGGGTGKIGDPSGKSVERPILDEEIIRTNVKAIAEQCRRFLTLDRSKGEAIVLNNDDWLSSLSLIPFLRDIGRCFRLGPMLGKENVRARLRSEEGMSFTEFAYQVLQGYDFYRLYCDEDVCVQSGGSDQWGNITAGIELIRKMKGKTAFGITYPLLTRKDGKKFGKSEEGAIWLDPEMTSPYRFYQYLVGVSDEEAPRLMRMLTFMNLKEIREFEENFRTGSFTPFAAQKRLAEEVTRFVHGEEGLNTALRVTEALRPGAGMPEDVRLFRELCKEMPFISLPATRVVEKSYVEVSVLAGLVKSKGEAQRLITGGGAYMNGARIEDISCMITRDRLAGGEYLVLGSGKKRKIVVQIV